MRRSTDAILTSHAGSLPRPDSLIDANKRGPFVLLTDTLELEQAPRAVLDPGGEDDHAGVIEPMRGTRRERHAAPEIFVTLELSRANDS